MDIRKYFGGFTNTSKSKTLRKEEKKPEKSAADTTKGKRKLKNEDIKPSASKKKKKVPVIFDSDSEEEPIPKKLRRKQKPNYDEEIAEFDSDSDDFKKVQRLHSQATPPKPVSRPLRIKPKSPPKQRTPVKFLDFFGAAPIERSDRTVFISKNKTITNNNSDDVEFHDDEEFAETLKLLDEEESLKKTAKRKSETQKVSANEEITVRQNGGLSSKLAAKVKASQNSIPEKPISPVKAACRRSPRKNNSKHEDAEQEQLVHHNSAAGKTDTIKSTSKPSKVEVNQRSTKKQEVAVNSPEMPKTSPAVNTNYRKYLQRSGPEAPGSKPIPRGAEACLKGLVFVVTGVLDSLDREEVAELVKSYGGKVTQSVSKSTSYIVIGRDAGPSKLDKAEKFKTKQLSEDELLNLIETLPGKGDCTSTPKTNKVNKMRKGHGSTKELGMVSSQPCSAKRHLWQEIKETVKQEQDDEPISSSNSKHLQKSAGSAETLMWVDKYKPTCTKQIIGQQGDKSNVKKLLAWLGNWHKNNSGNVKKKFQGKWSDDGSCYKAVLLSGPPGIGKTTSATLACQEVGFSFVELNASDTRSKRSLQEEVLEMLTTHSLTQYFEENGATIAKNCLLMDEVDGMSGNEDRGGVQELIQLIKTSKIPIICMCNDRNHPKIRSLANYCFDLRFYRPRVEQLKASVMSICYKEGLDISAQAAQEIIIGANQDVRQIYHHLSLWSAKTKSLTVLEAETEAKKARKDYKLGPFDVLKKVFSAEDHKTMSIHDKSDLFFHDYSIAPLFVQENYPLVRPRAAHGDKEKHLKLLSAAADSICDGDLVDRFIRRDQTWSLLPLQALYASVIPGERLSGYLTQQISFPSWLGMNSRKNKFDRLLQELTSHMRLRISANKTSVNMDYVPQLRDAIVRPLQQQEQQGVLESVAVLENYDLLREDLDSLLEVALWPGKHDPMSNVAPKVKAAFTRAYNSDGHLIPYAFSVNVTKKAKRAVSDSEALEGDLDGQDGEPEEEEEDNLEKDAMVKIKKPMASRSKKAKIEGEQSGSSTSKGKGRGKGKGKQRY